MPVQSSASRAPIARRAARTAVGRLERRVGPAHWAAIIHIVRAGETLSGIGVRYRVPVDVIAAANRLADPSFIRSGQQLRIPGAGASGAMPSPPGTAAVGWHAAVDGGRRRQRSAMRQLIVDEARRQHFPRRPGAGGRLAGIGLAGGVVSSAGAIGVMQLLPATADWVSAAMLGEPVNLWMPRSNVRAGVALLKHYLVRYGNRPMALAAYYQGQAGTDRHGIYPISQPYIASILLLERMFGG